MPNNKTLEDLAKQVVDSQSGLMSVDDLKVFFEDTPQAPVQQITTPAEPAPAPTPPASTVTPVSPAPVAAPEPVVSQPNVLDFVPEKFKDVDAKTSIEKMVKSYTELEAELRREREEKDSLDRIVKTFSEPTFDPNATQTPAVPQPIPGMTPGAQIEDVTDSSFFDAPTDSSTKVATRVATQVAGAMLTAYHNALTEANRRVQYVENFKAAHPDFNEYKDDMNYILRSRPDLDKKVESIAFVYEMAKQRYRARVEKIKKELGVQPTPQPAPQPTPVQQPVMTEAEMIEKVKAAILADINRRKAATGIAGGGPPQSPAARVQPGATNIPLSPEDQLFEEIRNSGPKKLEITLG